MGNLNKKLSIQRVYCSRYTNSLIRLNRSVKELFDSQRSKPSFITLAEICEESGITLDTPIVATEQDVKDFQELDNKTKRCRKMKQNIVVFTGAGISKESGLPTFRDTDGVWEKYDPAVVATPQGFESNTETALTFYNNLRLTLHKAFPNYAHKSLASLEKEHNVTIITQNIDDLHERAGSSKVIHLHGELRKVTSSRNRLDKECIQELDLNTPICVGDKAKDGSQLRPYIVMFGEYLTYMSEAIRLVKNADIFLCIGTSLRVFPANKLINYPHPEIPRFIIDPNEIDRLPEGFIHIKQPATKGIDIFLAYIQQFE